MAQSRVVTQASVLRERGALFTHNPNWGHGSDCADNGRDGTEFTSLQLKKKCPMQMNIKYTVTVAIEMY